MEKIKDRNEHQKQNLLKHQNLNTRQKYSQTPQHTETPPSLSEYHVCFCGIENGTKLPPQNYLGVVRCCPSLLFLGVRTERLYENLKLKSILYGIWKTVPGRKKKGEIKPVTKHPPSHRTRRRLLTRCINWVRGHSPASLRLMVGADSVGVC